MTKEQQKMVNSKLYAQNTEDKALFTRVEPASSVLGWAGETILMINKLTPDVKGKAFDPDWFILRQRLEEAERVMNSGKTQNN